MRHPIFKRAVRIILLILLIICSHPSNADEWTFIKNTNDRQIYIKNDEIIRLNDEVTVWIDMRYPDDSSNLLKVRFKKNKKHFAVMQIFSFYPNGHIEDSGDMGLPKVLNKDKIDQKIKIAAGETFVTSVKSGFSHEEALAIANTKLEEDRQYLYSQNTTMVYTEIPILPNSWPEEVYNYLFNQGI
jgi:hypothetical protein|nr:MAG TPA: hypothetical protein [Caudoviricetes sp.]